MFRQYILPWLTWLFYRIWTGTWRIQLVEDQNFQDALKRGDPIIFAHWHGHELAIVPLVSHYRIATMTSTSKDGQLIDFTIRRLGGATSRGSSTRGGIGALKGLVRLVGEGYRASMAVDGPKGPIYQAKPGVFELSRLAHAHIVPVGVANSRAITFKKSWNKAQLPLPFAKVVVRLGEPWRPMTREESPKDPAHAQRLEADISKACQHAATHLQ